MTTKQRRLIYEALALAITGLLGAFIIPTLVSVRESMAVVCGLLLMVGWFIWLGYFLYRANSN